MKKLQVTLGVILFVVGMILSHRVYAKEGKLKKKPVMEAALTDYFEDIGSPKPKEMATACLSTEMPRILSAIATKETKGDPTKRATGYRKAHYGAFQLNPKYWGKVSKDPVEQAQQAERVIKTLLEKSNGNWRIALNKFGGDTRGHYYDDIVVHLRAVPQM